MTNREIMAHIIKTVTNPKTEYSNGQDAIGWGTQFLDEADKRIHEIGFKEGVIAGKFIGQRDMRERIIYLLKNRFPVNLIEKQGQIDEINALPIEGE